jgi:hypothetical protein
MACDAVKSSDSNGRRSIYRHRRSPRTGQKINPVIVPFHLCRYFRNCSCDCCITQHFPILLQKHEMRRIRSDIAITLRRLAFMLIWTTVPRFRRHSHSTLCKSQLCKKLLNRRKDNSRAHSLLRWCGQEDSNLHGIATTGT